MAKALFCLDCGALKSFALDYSTTMCECDDAVLPPGRDERSRVGTPGKVVGWWLDYDTSLVQMAVLPPGRREKARVVVIHSIFLRADVDRLPAGYVTPAGQLVPFEPPQIDALWRDAHDQVTITPPRPETLTIFDRSRRACPLVILKPGNTPDTHWATDTELQKRGLIPEPAAV